MLHRARSHLHRTSSDTKHGKRTGNIKENSTTFSPSAIHPSRSRDLECTISSSSETLAPDAPSSSKPVNKAKGWTNQIEVRISLIEHQVTTRLLHNRSKHAQIARDSRQTPLHRPTDHSMENLNRCFDETAESATCQSAVRRQPFQHGKPVHPVMHQYGSNGRTKQMVIRSHL